MTTTQRLLEEKTRVELLLEVRQNDRYEILFAANIEASKTGTPFLVTLRDQVTLYKLDYQEWAQRQMNRCEEERAEDAEIAAGAAQYHESRLLP